MLWESVGKIPCSNERLRQITKEKTFNQSLCGSVPLYRWTFHDISCMFLSIFDLMSHNLVVFCRTLYPFVVRAGRLLAL